MKHVLLLKPWSRYRIDTVLRVLAPGEESGSAGGTFVGFVDQVRADQLVTDGFAEPYTPQPPEKTPVKADQPVTDGFAELHTPQPPEKTPAKAAKRAAKED